jgi:hypothetical protein
LEFGAQRVAAVGDLLAELDDLRVVLEVADVIVKQKDARSVISTLNPEYWNPSNKGDTCGYLAFSGFKLALPAANSGETAPAKASKPPKKGKPSPPPKAEDEDEDEDDDDDEDFEFDDEDE